MRVIVAGCGRVGAQLAVSLSEDGHAVAVIDKDSGAFARLDDDFSGDTFVGYVFDRPTLERAGIRQTQAFVAVTSGDNSNIVSARTAKERYGVERVVARIYDPIRADIYERLGITTIASSAWTAGAVLRELLPEGRRIETSVGAGEGNVAIVVATVPDAVHAVEASVLNRPRHSVLVAITRQGSTHLPGVGELLEGGDRVHLAVDRQAVDRVDAVMNSLMEDDG